MAVISCLACRRELDPDMFPWCRPRHDGTRRQRPVCQDCIDAGLPDEIRRALALAVKRRYNRERRANGDPWYTPVRMRAA